LNIVIPIKQVPETSNVKMDEKTGTMIREGVESIVNPLDLYSIEIGIQLKERLGGKITVISMGPPSAEKALKEALSMGCDHGVLITGREFAGSDTWSTSYALAEAIRRIGNYHLVICGERATDGDTGQVGPGIASFLDIPLATYVSGITGVSSDHLEVERLVEGGYEQLRLQLPALVTVVKEISYPRLPTLRGKQKARITEIQNLSSGDLNLDPSRTGLEGSPTRVVNIEVPTVVRNGTIRFAKDEESTARAVDEFLAMLKSKELI